MRLNKFLLSVSLVAGLLGASNVATSADDTTTNAPLTTAVADIKPATASQVTAQKPDGFNDGGSSQFDTTVPYFITDPNYRIWDTPYNKDSVVVANPSDYDKTAFKVLGTSFGDDNDLYAYITNGEMAKGWIYSGALRSAAQLQPQKTPSDYLQQATTDTHNATGIVNDLVSTGASLINTPLGIANNVMSTVHTAINNPISTVTNIEGAINGGLGIVNGGLDAVTKAVALPGVFFDDVTKAIAIPGAFVDMVTKVIGAIGNLVPGL